MYVGLIYLCKWIDRTMETHFPLDSTSGEKQKFHFVAQAFGTDSIQTHPAAN